MFSLKVKIGIAILIIIILVVLMDKYEIMQPMAILDGKSPFTTQDEKNKLRMEELIKAIHAQQGIAV